MAKENALGYFLAAARRRKGLTQAEVARVCGYSGAQFVSNWERGLSSPPLETLQQLVSLYQLDRKKLIALIMGENERRLRKILSPK